MTTHNLEQGFRISDRVAILTDGKISFDGYRKDLKLSKFKQIYQEKVG
jgi:ABC-type multidrug transport system ATPase subunit